MWQTKPKGKKGSRSAPQFDLRTELYRIPESTGHKVFVLKQQVELYRVYQDKIGDCDLRLRRNLESSGSKVDLKIHPIGPRLLDTAPHIIGSGSTDLSLHFARPTSYSCSSEPRAPRQRAVL